MTFSFQEVETLSRETTGQYLNPIWRIEREGRLQAAIIKDAIKLANLLREHEKTGHVLLPENLRRGINWQRKCMYTFTNFDYKEAVRWGIDHEKDGISAYQRLTRYRVVSTGLWIFPSGFVCCSPDGLIFSNSSASRPTGIIEIKCPYKLRNIRSFNPGSWTQMFPYLKSETELNRNHRYYDLIQAEIYATQAIWCDLFIWSPAKTLLLRVSRDETWIRRNIPLVEWFFGKYLYPLTPLHNLRKFKSGFKRHIDAHNKTMIGSEREMKLDSEDYSVSCNLVLGKLYADENKESSYGKRYLIPESKTNKQDLLVSKKRKHEDVLSKNRKFCQDTKNQERGKIFKFS